MNTLISLTFLFVGLWAGIEIYKHIKDWRNDR
jgi:hypothetical protein